MADDSADLVKSRLIGLISDESLQTAVDFGAAHGDLAMTTPGDTSMATLAEVVALATGAAHVSSAEIVPA